MVYWCQVELWWVTDEDLEAELEDRLASWSIHFVAVFTLYSQRRR